jgi:hypothetical protein
MDKYQERIQTGPLSKGHTTDKSEAEYLKKRLLHRLVEDTKYS